MIITGCFFDSKTEPNPNVQNQKSEIVGGEIIMQDVHGVNRGADAEAQFGMYQVNNQQKLSRMYRGLSRQVTAESSPCSISRSPIKAPTGSSRELVSVGRLLFGPLTSENLLEMKENSRHAYQYLLNEGIAAGLYQFVAEGKDKAPKFAEVLSMPEDLTQVLVNGFDFSKDPVNIKKSENMNISWNATSFENERDSIILTVMTDTQDEHVDLNCKIQERTLGKENKMTNWVIDKKEFQDMPTTSTNLGMIALLRYHILERKNKEPVLNLIGLRMYNTVAGIGE